MSEYAINIREIVKEEVDKYLKEVGFKKSIGFKDDEIFLLSKEEYEEYKVVIPKINCWWWLRSHSPFTPSHCSDSASGVLGSRVDFYGYSVSSDDCGVRPALKIPNIKLSNLKIGERFVKYDFPWIVIDTNFAIAEVPITFRTFDDKSNDYENSYVRKFLKNWLEERK